MKNLSLLVFILGTSLTALSQKDPEIMNIDGKSITKSEFLQIYLKNNDDPKYDSLTMNEYMDLFTKFKLKVAEAEALGYDTIPKLVNELEGYRKQLALPYLVDSAKNESLIEEAYHRTKFEVRASHILVRLKPNATPEDTLKAFNKISSIRKRIIDGEDFSAVAKGKGGSEDPSAAQNGGDLGYFNAFQMVFPFEDMAYKTEVGSVSPVFKTRFGYHILKVADKREARGTIQTAHIMIALDKQASKDVITEAQSKIDEIHAMLEGGENWDLLVQKYSDDPSSNKKGGILPAFGSGTTTRMVPSFEDAAFNLKKDGDYSQPIRTSYGYHIVKRVNWKPVSTYEELKEALERKVAKDERSKTTQNTFVEKLKVQYGFKDKTKKTLAWFVDHVDSNFYKGKTDISTFTSDKPIFILNGVKFTQQQFAVYFKQKGRATRKGEPNTIVNNLYKNWEKEAILKYETSQLSSKYPAYKALITEYHDGILLYEIMSDKVWNYAMKDTSGLQEFYNTRNEAYQWSERINADVYELFDANLVDSVNILLQSDSITPVQVVKSINTDSDLNVKHRKSKFEISKTAFLQDRTFKLGVNEAYKIGEKYYIIVVNEMLPAGNKTFSEAKGAITSDYQNYLEKNWIEELRVKHAITINNDILYNLGE